MTPNQIAKTLRAGLLFILDENRPPRPEIKQLIEDPTTIAAHYEQMRGAMQAQIVLEVLGLQRFPRGQRMQCFEIIDALLMAYTSTAAQFLELKDKTQHLCSHSN